jgi:hypothetical protein
MILLYTFAFTGLRGQVDSSMLLIREGRFHISVWSLETVTEVLCGILQANIRIVYPIRLHN